MYSEFCLSDLAVFHECSPDNYSTRVISRDRVLVRRDRQRALDKGAKKLISSCSLPDLALPCAPRALLRYQPWQLPQPRQ